MVKSFRNNRKLVRFPEKRGSGLPEFLYFMNIEAEESGPSQLSGFEGIPVYWGSGFEGFHCISELTSHLNLSINIHVYTYTVMCLAYMKGQDGHVPG